MAKWPNRSHLVLECKMPHGNKLYAMGYKYNQRRVLGFIFTEKAGSSSPGTPYKAKFTRHGVVHTRDVPRPQVISEYFPGAIVIDTHNLCRQGELALEKYWVCTILSFASILHSSVSPSRMLGSLSGLLRTRMRTSET